MELVFAAISLGFLGSFHCIGMCGPIALALPVHRYSPLKKSLAIFLYNLGRVMTYTFMGLLFGLLGQSFFMGGFQQALSISIGVLLLASVWLTQLHNVNVPGSGFLYRFVNGVKLQLGKFFNRKGLRFLFLIGLLNGLLPCGLVYLGIAGSVASGDYMKGAAFMLYFGLGTIPVMYAVAFLGQFITLNNRNRIRRAMPFVVSMMAVMLIIRGLNLGIPYLSPAFGKNNHNVSCCETPNAYKGPVKTCCQKK